ncbi:hypothetical protein L7F22_047535 [Adiantum nelumboides]|nr:hypothetical protein [Adiantum nelumboides]
MEVDTKNIEDEIDTVQAKQAQEIVKDTDAAQELQGKRVRSPVTEVAAASKVEKEKSPLKDTVEEREIEEVQLTAAAVTSPVAAQQSQDISMSQPDVVSEPSPVKTAAVTGERKKKARKGPNNDDVPPLAVVELEPCKPAAVTKEGKKGALKAQQPGQIATPQGQDAPLSADVPREACQGVASKKALKTSKEIQPTKQGLKRATPLKIDAPLSTDVPREPCQGVASKKAPKAPKIATSLQIATPLKIAMPPGHDAPLSTDIPREQGEGSVLKKAPKVPKEAQPTKHVRFVQGQDAPLSSDVPQEPCQDASLKKAPAPKEIQPTKQIATPLKIAMPEGQDAPLSADVPREQGQGATLKKALKAPKVPKEAKQDMIVLERSSPLKVQKSGQAKKLSGTASSELPKTQCFVIGEEEKGQGRCERERRYGGPRATKCEEVEEDERGGVREAIDRKLAVDEVKVKGHTGKVQLEKVLEVKIALKREGVKNKAKKHVEKGQEDEGPADKALALVGSSKRPRLQVKRAKQSRASCTTSTTVVRSP